MNALCSEAAGAKAVAASLTTPCRRAVLLIERIRNAYGQVYALLSYEPDKNYLLMKWSGFCTEEEVKAASLRMLDWQRTQGRAKGCKFHVHDTNEIESAWAGLVDWINNELFPDCFQAGLRYNVSILSPDLFSRLSSQALYQKQNAKVPTVLCETLSQAERWIAQKYKEL